MKNYASQLKQINAYFNKKSREIKKAPRLFSESSWKWIDNPTKKQRDSALKKNEKKRAEIIARLDAAKNAEKLTYLKISVEWHKSRTWGHNPSAEAWTTGDSNGGFYGTGRASGCGYDKESAAVGEALAGSHSLRRFLIENNIECYGVGSCYGLKYLEISGKGVGELLRIFRGRKGWTVSEMHGRSFDGYEIRKK